jgi:hypothetical protein
VKTDKPAAESQVSKKPERRSDRYPVVVPVKVQWLESNGAGVIEFAEAKEVNWHGGLLEMKGCPAVGSVIELTNVASSKTASARVLSLRPSRTSKVLGVAVELVTPNETFWGLTFRLKKAIDDLSKLAHAIRSGVIDPRVLRDFRDSIDYVRKTAWAVQEMQERQAHQRETATVRSLLTTERIRRTTQLSKALAGDLDSHEVTSETAGIADLFGAIESLRAALARIVQDR